MYSVTFVAGSFGDTGGLLNAEETETFTVTQPTVALENPVKGQVIDVADFNARGYVDITFAEFHGGLVDGATITDSDAEITITADGVELEVLGSALLVSGTTYRYFFTGHATGALTITFIDGSWRNLNGIAWSSQAQTVDGESYAASADPTAVGAVDAATVVPRTWFDVTFTTPGSTVDAVSIITAGGGLLTLSGGGSEALTFVSVQQIDENTFRYPYTGTLSTGTVTVAFNAGTWTDAQGNAGAAGSQTFRLITQGTSFYIELSGGIMLEAAGLIDEPLIDLSATVILEIDTARSVFKLTFVGQLSIIKLGTVGATAGVFVLDMGDGLSEAPQFWGVATLETNFDALKPYGLDLYAKGTLQINLTGETKTETITLPGLGAGGSDLTRTFELAPYSFGLELVGQVLVSVPGGGPELLRVNGGFFLDIAASAEPHFTMFFTGSVSFGSGAAQLTYGQTTGLLLIDGDGVAGTFSVAAAAGSACPTWATSSPPPAASR